MTEMWRYPLEWMIRREQRRFPGAFVLGAVVKGRREIRPWPLEWLLLRYMMWKSADPYRVGYRFSDFSGFCLDWCKKFGFHPKRAI